MQNTRCREVRQRVPALPRSRLFGLTFAALALVNVALGLCTMVPRLLGSFSSFANGIAHPTRSSFAKRTNWLRRLLVRRTSKGEDASEDEVEENQANAEANALAKLLRDIDPDDDSSDDVDDWDQHEDQPPSRVARDLDQGVHVVNRHNCCPSGLPSLHKEHPPFNDGNDHYEKWTNEIAGTQTRRCKQVIHNAPLPMSG